MINLGEYNTLTIARAAEAGLYLSDNEGQSVLLPNKLCSKEYNINDELRVFVLNDSEDRMIATTETPKITLNHFALLKVSALTQFGAFMEWGMEKELMIPFKEQKEELEEGRWYVVFMGLDEQTDRLFGSTKLQKYLQNEELSVKEGDKVEILIYKKTDIGYTVIVNEQHFGLVYNNEIFDELNVGEVTDAYVKNIRPDNKIDVSLQPIGYQNFISQNSEDVYRLLEKNKGHLAVSDKSTPALIYDKFGMSKKAFKKALGDLYKQRKITISKDGINIV